MRALLIGASLALTSAVPVGAQDASPRGSFSTAPAPQPGTPPDAYTLQQERAARARDNLVALRQGRISVADLTPQEQQDVIDLDRMSRGEGADNRSFKQQCIDEEVRRAGGNPSRLAWEVIRLKCK